MTVKHKPNPISAPFWTPGVYVMVALMAIAAAFVIARYIGGLAAITNLKQTHPWGLWIGVDVGTGVALAAGGFTTAALSHIFGRHSYEAVTRPALLTAMLGYTFVAVGLTLDLGRSWAIWKPMVYWQPNSVLFEVAMCVVIYLTVLYIEFIPAVAERFGNKLAFLDTLNRNLSRVMWIFLIAGVVLSCMHQSGLGSLMLIAPTKVHPLWYTPLLPLLFLLSAIAVGFPMVVFETTIITSSLNLYDEMEILTPLTKITIYLLGIYATVKVGDMIYRETYVYLLEGSAQSWSFLTEILLGVILPWVMLMSPSIRKSRKWLFIACSLIVGGVALNRVNVFLVSYQPPYAQQSYFPSFGEIMITVGLISTIMFIYRLAITYLPVLSAGQKEVAP